MTPEEQLRVNEIGKDYYPTLPPQGWVETPGEFEPLRGVFVTWIYSQSSYRPIFREIVREVAEVCKCYVIASSSDTTSIKSYLTSNGVPLDSVVFYVWPYNSIWMRDYGPWFMRKQDNSEGMVDFIYNRPRPLDDTISRCISYRWQIPFYNSPLTHAGGNFMTDGLGTGFASTLIYQENSSFTARQIDSFMRIYSGLDQLVIVPRINIEYTGHIDLWTKILNDTLVMVGSYAQGHSNYSMLNSNADSISRCKNREGINYRIVRIPMPWSTSDAPPTYLNSLFVNNKVLVPTWSLPEDDTGLAVYQHALPGYEVVGINCAAMSGSGGAIHCITMQIPKSQYIHIKHKYLTSTNDTINPYRIRTQIITSSSLVSDSTYIVYFMNSDTHMYTTPLAAVTDSQGIYAGYIPAWSFGDTIYYYMTVRNSQGIVRNSPKSAPVHKYTLYVIPGASVEQEICPYILYAYKAYPNPTNNKINFIVNIAKPGKISIELFNSIGQRIKNLVDDELSTGVYNFQFNLSNHQMQKLPYGAYFYRIKTDQETKLGKVLYIK
jgi:agmatine/peptidylarginine deiminase